MQVHYHFSSQFRYIFDKCQVLSHSIWRQKRIHCFTCCSRWWTSFFCSRQKLSSASAKPYPPLPFGLSSASQLGHEPLDPRAKDTRPDMVVHIRNEAHVKKAGKRILKRLHPGDESIFLNDEIKGHFPATQQETKY